MKKVVCLLLMLIVICSISFAVEFTDFDLKNPYLGEGYEHAMEVLVEKGVIAGYPDGSFKPGNTITRAEFSKVVVKAFDINVDPNATTPFFTDIKETDWFRGFVLALANEKVILGYEDGSFGPKREITLGEIVLILDRLVGYSDGKEANPDRPALANIWDFAMEGGLFKGYLTDDMVSIKPETRENVVILVYNAMMYKKEKSEQEPEPVTPPVEPETPSTEPEEIKETVLTANKTYFGVVGARIEEKGETFVEINTFETGIVRLKILKLDKIPTEKSLIFFTPKKSGKVALEKEFKIVDIDEGFLLVDEIEEETVIFDGEENYLDTTEDYYMLGETKIKLYNLEYYLVTVEDDEIEGVAFTGCEKLEKPNFKEDDRVFFDTAKDMCIILRGLEVLELPEVFIVTAWNNPE